MDYTLELFKKEVLDKGPSACLPRNLSDFWLDVLILDLDSFLTADNDDGEYGEYGMAAMLCLLWEIRGSKTINVPLEEYFEMARLYIGELALEQLHRKTKYKYEPATLENILRNRSVSVKDVSLSS